MQDVSAGPFEDCLEIFEWIWDVAEEDEMAGSLGYKYFISSIEILLCCFFG